MRGISGKGLLAITFWGASFVATRIALEAFHPFALVALRLLMGTALLGMLLHVRRRPLLPAAPDRGRCVLLGVVLAIHLGLQACGLLYTTAIHSGWIIGFFPIAITIGAELLGQQRLLPRGWYGVFMGFVGVLLVASREPPDFEHAQFGDFLQIISCVTWAVYTLAGKGPVARNGSLRVTAASTATAAVLMLLVCLPVTPLRGPLHWDALLALLFLGLLCSGAAYALWYRAAEEHGPTRVAALLYLEPFVTLFVAWWLLREPFGWNVVSGGLFVLAGVALVARGTRPAK